MLIGKINALKKIILEIIPSTTNDLISTCFSAKLKKTISGLYRCELENFTQKQDLKILFLKPTVMF